MKNWFPFTDYDFYAYLSSGMIVLFALDYGINDGAVMFRNSWPFVQVVFLIATAYIVGHIIAGFASVLLEQWLGRRFLRSPVSVMMDMGASRFRERVIRCFFAVRYYEPQSEHIRSKILQNVAERLGKEPERIDNPEEVFQVAFPVARAVPDAAARLDEFRRMYGFSRNVALSGVVGAGALVYKAATSNEVTLYLWAAVVAILSICMFGRFVKFYAAFGSEVLRTYASKAEEKS